MAAIPNTIEKILGQVVLVGSNVCWKLSDRALDQGYARLGKKREPAHRYVYRHLIGRIPRGLTLDHLCRNRWCVHPNHVDPVTSSMNVMRGDTVVAANARKRRCLRGHRLSGENLRITNGRRCCKECQRQRVREHRMRGGQS